MASTSRGQSFRQGRNRWHHGVDRTEFLRVCFINIPSALFRPTPLTQDCDTLSLRNPLFFISFPGIAQNPVAPSVLQPFGITAQFGNSARIAL